MEPDSNAQLRDAQLHEAIVRAIVHLNFNEADQALGVLLGALADSNWKETVVYGNRTQFAA